MKIVRYPAGSAPHQPKVQAGTNYLAEDKGNRLAIGAQLSASLAHQADEATDSSRSLGQPAKLEASGGQKDKSVWYRFFSNICDLFYWACDLVYSAFSGNLKPHQVIETQPADADKKEESKVDPILVAKEEYLPNEFACFAPSPLIRNKVLRPVSLNGIEFPRRKVFLHGTNGQQLFQGLELSENKLMCFGVLLSSGLAPDGGELRFTEGAGYRGIGMTAISGYDFRIYGRPDQQKRYLADNMKYALYVRKTATLESILTALRHFEKMVPAVSDR